MSEKSLFQRPFWVAFFAFSAAFLWGWAYPIIKMGFGYFGIAADMTGSKMLFAGIRFCSSGVIILIMALFAHKPMGFNPIGGSKLRAFRYVMAYALLNTTLHYAAFYIGLSHSEGARAAILNSLSVFLLVILACLFFKSDKMTLKKMLGCVVGFLGVASLSLGNGESGEFTLLGDGMIILNTLCAAIAGLMTRGVGKRVNVFVGTGYSLGAGGLMLLLTGLLMGGTLPQINMGGIICLSALIVISTVGFGLYNKLLTCNPIGKVAIWNSLIPIVGCITSVICLGEPFTWKYLFAAVLATAGVYIINREK